MLSDGSIDELVIGSFIGGGSTSAYAFIPKEIVDQFNYVTLDSNTSGRVYYDNSKSSYTAITKGVKTAISSLNPFSISLGFAGGTTYATMTLSKS